MIIKFEFDVFYTVIQIAADFNDFVVDDIYDDFYAWMQKSPQHCVETEVGLSYSFNDDILIKWLKEIRFNHYKIEILEKHLGIDEISNFKPDIIMYF